MAKIPLAQNDGEHCRKNVISSHSHEEDLQKGAGIESHPIPLSMPPVRVHSSHKESSVNPRTNCRECHFKGILQPPILRYLPPNHLKFLRKKPRGCKF